jgi:FHA domain
MPAVATSQTVSIHVRTPDGRDRWYDVTEDDSLIVGSSQSCTVRLECSDVASMHCLIRLENGRLSVQDWYTALGTFLNGERIQQPCTFGPGDEIRIGDFRLTTEVFDGPRNDESEESSHEDTVHDSSSRATFLNDSCSLDNSFSLPQPVEDERSVAEWARESELETANTAFRDQSVLSEGPAHSAAEFRQLRLRVTELELENEELRFQSLALKGPGADADPFDLEMLDLLKSEIQQLQHEVAQRDARLAELAETDRAAGTDEDHEESDETAALLERLDQMLAELQLSDERAATLEDLLRAADEATRAESEERRQLVSWMEDIEARIGEREAEWQAAQDALQGRIDALHADRERFSERLKELGNRDGTAASAKLIEDLREEVETLRRKLDLAEQACAALRKKIDDTEFQNSIEARDKYIEQKIREERLEMAQEHTRIARERAEVARMKAQLETKAPPEPQKLDEATCRVQAFREHLKDVHVKESRERDTKKLSSRLARLWKRLDGN